MTFFEITKPQTFPSNDHVCIYIYIYIYIYIPYKHALLYAMIKSLEYKLLFNFFELNRWNHMCINERKRYVEKSASLPCEAGREWIQSENKKLILEDDPKPVEWNDCWNWSVRHMPINRHWDLSDPTLKD